MFNLDVLAETIAIKMKSINNEKTASVEVLKYGLNIFINVFSIILVSTVVGIATGELLKTLLALITFAILRACTGGHHLKSSYYCILFSTVIFSTIPHIPLNQDMVLILTIISLVLIIVFAPFGIENQSNIPKNFYPLLKFFAALLVGLNIFVLSSTLAVSFLVQSLTLIRRIGGEKHEKTSSI